MHICVSAPIQAERFSLDEGAKAIDGKSKEQSFGPQQDGLNGSLRKMQVISSVDGTPLT